MISVETNTDWQARLAALRDDRSGWSGASPVSIKTEQKLGSSGMKTVERVFKSSCEIKDYEFPTYDTLLFFVETLESVEGLSERFLDLPIQPQHAIMRCTSSDPITMSSMITAIEDSGLTNVIFVRSNEYEDRIQRFLDMCAKDLGYFPEFSSNFCKVSRRFSQYLFKVFDPRLDYAYSILLFLHISNGEKQVLDLMNRWINENFDGNILDFIKILKSDQELKDYPLEWAIALLTDGDTNH